LAQEAALAAGRLLKEELGQVREVRHKGFRDLVTELDLAAQAEITARIRQAFPGHGLMAEEDDSKPDLAGPIWIVDPLDGTTNFVHGLPAYSVSICLALDGKLTVGVIFDPERDELFWAKAGQGAWLNGRPMKVSGVDSLSQSLVVTGFAYDVEKHLDEDLARFGRMLVASQAVRRLGSAALDLAWVACGRMEAFWEEGLQPWDLAAGALLVVEAGGVVTSLQGGPFELLSGKILASNGLVQEEMVQALRL